MRSVSRGKTWEGRCGFGRGSKNQRQERIRSWQTAVSINHTSVLAKADFFHTCEYIHRQLANSNIVKTSDLFRKEDLAEVESEVGVIIEFVGLLAKQDFIQFWSLVFIRPRIPVEFPLAPWYKSLHRHLERDPDRCPVGISAGTYENTSALKNLSNNTNKTMMQRKNRTIS